MKICTACQSDNTDSANYCNICGYAIVESSSEIQNTEPEKYLVGWLVPLHEPWVSVRIDSRDVTLGRSSQSSIDLSQFLGTQMERALSTVSRLHAHLHRSEMGQVYIIDNQARNKTYINGVELIPNEKTELPDNALLKLGKLELKFKKF